MFTVKRIATGYNIYYNGELVFFRKSKAEYSHMVIWVDFSQKGICPWWISNTLCKSLARAEKDNGKQLDSSLNYKKFIVEIEQ
jgi:hypothetical protein